MYIKAKDADFHLCKNANILFLVHDTQLAKHQSLIHRPAVHPDLAIRPCERADIAHVHHCRREVAAKPITIGRVALDQFVSGAAVVQRLVGVQQPLAVEEAGEVAVVEGVRRGHIKRREAAIVAACGLGAVGTQRRRKRAVDVGVVVDPVLVVLALRAAYGVGSCRDVHFTWPARQQE